MISEFRSRPDGAVFPLAIKAAARAGVTRVSDVSEFSVPGIRVWQATRPATRTLAVSQGKGLTARAAIIGALLETVELWAAEQLPPADCMATPEALGPGTVAIWAPGDSASGHNASGMDIGRSVPREWLRGADLLTGHACPIPRDLLALGERREATGLPRTSNGLATGNSREEALLSGLAEVIEHHCIAGFRRATPHQRMQQQIALATVDDPALARLIRRVQDAGFRLLAWSIGAPFGVAVIQCTMFHVKQRIELLPPVTGNGCHPDPRVAFMRALFECVQTQATLVAGARDDLAAGDYADGPARIRQILAATLGFGPGQVDWRSVPDLARARAHRDAGEGCVMLLERIARVTRRPVLAYHHEPVVEGLHIAHVLAPGLRDDLRDGEPAAAPDSPPVPAATARPRLAPTLIATADGVPGKAESGSRLLFAGPSIYGLAIPPEISLRPPAIHGDLGALLAAPPAMVALVDGCFKTAPTVWHSEILALIARGTRVIGGASLGALRAAELDRFDMEGVGSIYHACRDGLLMRDDAVMLAHAPEAFGYAPLTVALVDAEHALLHADLLPQARRMMQRIIRRASYEERDWPHCLAQYRMRTGAPFPLTAAQLSRMPSLKREDARLVIERMMAPIVESTFPAAPPPAGPEITPAPISPNRISPARINEARAEPASAAIPI